MCRNSYPCCAARCRSSLEPPISSKRARSVNTGCKSAMWSPGLAVRAGMDRASRCVSESSGRHRAHGLGNHFVPQAAFLAILLLHQLVVRHKKCVQRGRRKSLEDGIRRMVLELGGTQPATGQVYKRSKCRLNIQILGLELGRNLAP